jgi:tryptophanyl-tRNA synthetase
MDRDWDTIVDDVQRYLSCNVAVLSHVNEQFLEALAQRERTQKDLCLVPFARFQLYHVRLERKVRHRINRRRAA